MSFLQVHDLGNGQDADVGAGRGGGTSPSSLQLEVQGLVTMMMAILGEHHHSEKEGVENRGE